MAKGNKQSDHWLKVVEAGFSAGLERYQAYRIPQTKRPTPRRLVLQQRQAIIANRRTGWPATNAIKRQMKTRQTVLLPPVPQGRQ